MTYYRIDKLKGINGVSTTKEELKLRKDNLRITNMLWICYGVEIDPMYINATYEKKFAIIVWLN